MLYFLFIQIIYRYIWHLCTYNIIYDYLIIYSTYRYRNRNIGLYAVQIKYCRPWNTATMTTSRCTYLIVGSIWYHRRSNNGKSPSYKCPLKFILPFLAVQILRYLYLHFGWHRQSPLRSHNRFSSHTMMYRNHRN